MTLGSLTTQRVLTAISTLKGTLGNDGIIRKGYGYPAPPDAEVEFTGQKADREHTYLYNRKWTPRFTSDAANN